MTKRNVDQTLTRYLVCEHFCLSHSHSSTPDRKETNPMRPHCFMYDLVFIVFHRETSSGRNGVLQIKADLDSSVFHLSLLWLVHLGESNLCLSVELSVSNVTCRAVIRDCTFFTFIE